MIRSLVRRFSPTIPVSLKKMKAAYQHILYTFDSSNESLSLFPINSKTPSQISFAQPPMPISVAVAGGVMSSLRRVHSPRVSSHVLLSPPPPSLAASCPLVSTTATSCCFFPNLNLHSGRHYRHRNQTAVAKASSQEKDSLIPSDDAEDGVLLGTMKLPSDTDLPRFQILLFQWANSLCQGANLPLDMPLKVDKIAGGTRLGFVTIGNAEVEVPVYIDCLVFPPSDGSGPIFRAVRSGPLKDKTPPGEPRIMRNLMQALQKSVQIARL
ncbi:uncharacterized protein [Malus domestica]|uniref:uncharacterized protein n=1 Tax=Malus domestica TaxID=3750 RepID=UPI003975D66E